MKENKAKLIWLWARDVADIRFSRTWSITAVQTRINYGFSYLKSFFKTIKK